MVNGKDAHFAQGAGDSAFVGQNKLFPFSTVVFTSWDYHLTDVKAARNLRNSIRNQLAEMVFDAELADAYISKGKRIASIMLKVHLCPRLPCLPPLRAPILLNQDPDLA